MLATPMSRVPPPQHPQHPHHALLNPISSSPSSSPFCKKNDGMADHHHAAATQPAPKKPKLSLQTSSLPITYGKSSTTLTVTATALEHATPTALNTFANAYSIPLRPSPNTTTISSPGGASFRHHHQTQTPLSATATASRRTPSHSYSHQHQYALLGLKSILRNTPHRSTSASPATTRRVFFPPRKHVAFRATPELEEVIRNVRYVAAHADLTPESDSDSDSSNPPPPTTTPTALEAELSASDSASDSDSSAASSTSRKRKSRHLVEAIEVRESRPENLRLRKYSARPKRRRWEWTLAPVSTSAEEEQAECSMGDDTSVQDRGGDSASTLTTHIATPTLSLLVSPSRIALPASLSPDEGAKGEKEANL